MIYPCPACGGRHYVSDDDLVDFVCSGGGKPREKFRRMTDVSPTGADWNTNHFDTRVTERRDVTIIRPQLATQTRLKKFTRKDMNW